MFYFKSSCALCHSKLYNIIHYLLVCSAKIYTSGVSFKFNFYIANCFNMLMSVKLLFHFSTIIVRSEFVCHFPQLIAQSHEPNCLIVSALRWGGWKVGWCWDYSYSCRIAVISLGLYIPTICIYIYLYTKIFVYY